MLWNSAAAGCRGWRAFARGSASGAAWSKADAAVVVGAHKLISEKTLYC